MLRVTGGIVFMKLSNIYFTCLLLNIIPFLIYKHAKIVTNYSYKFELEIQRNSYKKNAKYQLVSSGRFVNITNILLLRRDLVEF
jgi:hypothetical protein